MGAGVRCWIYAVWLTTFLTSAVGVMTEGPTTVDEDTQLALEEVSRLFRRLFPLVPDKAQYFWKTSHLGGTLLLRNHELNPMARDGPDVRVGGTSPWRLELQFRKRGPDCMRKCIAQGVLHPVQCHSLC